MSLWNIRMPDKYYRLAEEEFATAVDEYNKDHWLDIAAYKAPTDHVDRAAGSRFVCRPACAFGECRVFPKGRLPQEPHYEDHP